MKIGIPKEIKNNEGRVALTPDDCKELINHGHEVWIEEDAYINAVLTWDDYTLAYVKITDKATLFNECKLIVKVKEPQPEELHFFEPYHILFSYLHLANEPELTKGLCQSGCTAVAFETITDKNGLLPLLAPMSEIAGKLAIHNGCNLLHSSKGGSGVLLGGLNTTERGTVIVLGYGVAGKASANLASDMGANVIVFDKDMNKLKEAMDYNKNITALYSSESNIKKYISQVDLLIGAVLLPGKKAPMVVTENMVKMMKPGSVIVDIAIDQGGCIETSKPTSHSKPTFVKHGVTHFCVTNMPGAVPKTSSIALSSNILKYVLELTNYNFNDGLNNFYGGLNIYNKSLILEL